MRLLPALLARLPLELPALPALVALPLELLARLEPLPALACTGAAGAAGAAAPPHAANSNANTPSAPKIKVGFKFILSLLNAIHIILRLTTLPKHSSPEGTSALWGILIMEMVV